MQLGEFASAYKAVLSCSDVGQNLSPHFHPPGLDSIGRGGESVHSHCDLTYAGLGIQLCRLIESQGKELTK